MTGAWSYNYDTLNRLLAAASATTNTSSQYAGKNGCWGYDPFGNRTAEYYQAAACPTPETSVPVAGVNQITYNGSNQVLTVNQSGSPTNLHGAFQYDGAGNVLNDITNKYLYDAEGRLCAVENLTLLTMTGYIYGADGARVAKGPITSWSCNPATNGFLAVNNAYTSYVLGLGGEQVSEIGVSGSTNSWKHTNIFAGGKLIATYNGAGVPGTYFDLTDWLGTKRAEFGLTSNGGCLSTYFSLAYGDGLATITPSGFTAFIACNADATEQHFTGKERDTESGNDYFGARYYASSMGRFMSPDPLPWIHWQRGNEDDQNRFEGFIANPQNFNLYAYVNNNPLNKTDPTGMNACGTNNDSSCKVTVTITDRSKDANGNYNDKYAGLTGNGSYNATATVSVNGKVTGTFLASTVPSGPGLATIQNGTYSGTLTTHDGHPAISLNNGGPVPVVGGRDPATGKTYATNVEVHIAGHEVPRAPLGLTGMTLDGRPVSAGCQLVCTKQYGSFERATGMSPSDGSQPQQNFTVNLNAGENQ